MNNPSLRRAAAVLAGSALIAALATAPTMASTSQASRQLAGTYQTTIAHDPALGGHLNGTWTITFTKNGAYTVKEDGRVGERGKASITPNRITFGHETGFLACPTSGLYKWKLTGKRLKFSRIRDKSCPGRAGVLAHHFTRVG
jgi:hypothetical protein